MLPRPSFACARTPELAVGEPGFDAFLSWEPDEVKRSTVPSVSPAPAAAKAIVEIVPFVRAASRASFCSGVQTLFGHSALSDFSSCIADWPKPLPTPSPAAATPYETNARMRPVLEPCL